MFIKRSASRQSKQDVCAVHSWGKMSIKRSLFSQWWRIPNSSFNTHFTSLQGCTLAVWWYTGKLLRFSKALWGLLVEELGGWNFPSVVLPPPEHTCLIMQWLGSLALFMLWARLLVCCQLLCGNSWHKRDKQPSYCVNTLPVASCLLFALPISLFFLSLYILSLSLSLYLSILLLFLSFTLSLFHSLSLYAFPLCL